MSSINIVLVSLYRYQSFAVRILHPLLKSVEGVRPHTIFFKNLSSNRTEMPTRAEVNLFADLIASLNPALVGFSVMSPFAPAAKRLSKLVKENSRSLVIWGGVHPTICPDACIGHADMLCLGEGEGAISELACALRDGTAYRSIKNLWVKDGDKIIKNPLRPLIQDLDSLPAAYGQADFYFIHANKMSTADPLPVRNYYLQASRGCPYSCSYCVNSVLHPMFKGLGPQMRRRSVDNIIKEIKSSPAVVADPDMRVVFLDEVFPTDAAWLEEFRIKYKQEVGRPLWLEYNPNDTSAEMVEKLVSCGLQLIKFGIQTGSEQVCDQIYGRPGKNSRILDLIVKIRPLNIKIKFDFMLGNPYDTRETLKEYIEFLLKLPKPLYADIYLLQFFPGYPLTQKALKDKHISDKDIQEDKVMANLRRIGYQPRLFPVSRKHALENIIWLFCLNHAGERTVRLALKDKNLVATLALVYLDLKSIVLGAIFSDTGLAAKYPLVNAGINAWRHLYKAEFGIFIYKLKKRIKKS